MEDTCDIVYPCDLDPMGICPKWYQDCANCKGWCATEIEWYKKEED